MTRVPLRSVHGIAGQKHAELIGRPHVARSTNVVRREVNQT